MERKRIDARTGWGYSAWLLLAGLLGLGTAVAAEEAKGGKPWLEMNYGPYLTASIESSVPERGITQKAVAIQVGTESPAYVSFDKDLLRYSVGWTGELIDFHSIVFDGSHRTWPAVAGEEIFGTRCGPGWAKGGSFEDPRQRYPSTDYEKQPAHWQNRGYGPLPGDWGRYRGLYLYGQQVVLSYEVGRTAVLDMPGLEKFGKLAVFTRTLNIAPCDQELVLLVTEHPAKGSRLWSLEGRGARAASATTTGVLLGDQASPAGLAVALKSAGRPATWQVVDGSRLLLHISPGTAGARLKILMTRAGADDLATFAGAVKSASDPEDLSGKTHGGPARWQEIITTAGKNGAGNNAYTIDTLTAPALNPWKSRMRFGGFDFFKGGKRAAICTWDGDVWIVDGIDDKLERLAWRRIATGMFQPLGLKIVANAEGGEEIFVCCRDQIARLHDLNGDGEIDYYECFNGDQQVTEHFHEFAMGLQTDAEGNFYYAKSARHALDAVVPQHGTLLKVSKDGSKTEIVCNGFRAANGVGFGPNGELAATDQEGFWMPANRINLVHPAGFYGNLWSYPLQKRTMAEGYDAPVCWIPTDVDRSPAEDLWVSGSKWGPLEGKMIHTSYGMGKLFLVVYESIDGVVQGGIVPMQGLSFGTGIMRGRFNPADGQLYVCGLVGWSSNCAEPGGFYRVRYTSRPLLIPTSVNVERDGIRIGFAEGLDQTEAEDTENYAVHQWQYRWTEKYGSAHYSMTDPSKQGHDEMRAAAAKLSADGKSVFLQIADLKPVMQMRIDVSVKTADGQTVKAVIHNTINRVPGGK